MFAAQSSRLLFHFTSIDLEIKHADLDMIDKTFFNLFADLEGYKGALYMPALGVWDKLEVKCILQVSIYPITFCSNPHFMTRNFNICEVIKISAVCKVYGINSSKYPIVCVWVPAYVDEINLNGTYGWLHVRSFERQPLRSKNPIDIVLPCAVHVSCQF